VFRGSVGDFHCLGRSIVQVYTLPGPGDTGLDEGRSASNCAFKILTEMTDHALVHSQTKRGVCIIRTVGAVDRA
jgi:hypothetical protein